MNSALLELCTKKDEYFKNWLYSKALDCYLDAKEIQDRLYKKYCKELLPLLIRIEHAYIAFDDCKTDLPFLKYQKVL